MFGTDAQPEQLQVGPYGRYAPQRMTSERGTPDLANEMVSIVEFLLPLEDMESYMLNRERAPAPSSNLLAMHHTLPHPDGNATVGPEVMPGGGPGI